MVTMVTAAASTPNEAQRPVGVTLALQKSKKRKPLTVETAATTTTTQVLETPANRTPRSSRFNRFRSGGGGDRKVRTTITTTSSTRKNALQDGVLLQFPRHVSPHVSPYVPGSVETTAATAATTTSATTTSKTKSSSSNSSSSYQVFIDSSIMYVVCILGPVLLGHLYHWYDRYDDGTSFLAHMLQPVASLVCGSSTLDSSSRWSSVLHSVSHYLSHYLCSGNDAKAATGNIVDTILTSLWWFVSTTTTTEQRPLLPPTITIDPYDAVFVVVCTLTLALLRIVVVRIPDDPTMMIRVKSIHLLSADYLSTPVVRRPVLRPVGLPILPSLDNDDDDDINDDSMFGLNLDSQDEDDDHDNSSNYNSSTTTTTTTMPSPLTAPLPSERSSGAAARCATATFRWIYTTAVLATAWRSFSSARFWPWYVGGTGRTAHCWDLYGGVAVDHDFDSYNRVLKHYFLIQASYHLHSTTFHVVSLGLLLLSPSKSVATETSSWTGLYIRRFIQHGVTLLLFATAYIFSSLRRLVTIGIFAFDVSSWCLHVLQICVNTATSPAQTPVAKILRAAHTPARLARFYRYVVIPVFVFARFFVWPCLWYSVTYESALWLQQLEQTTWVGAAAQFRMAIHVISAALGLCTGVYFRRLLRHPQLQNMAAA